MSSPLHEAYAAGRSLWVGLFPAGSTHPDDRHCTLLYMGRVESEAGVASVDAAAYAARTIAGEFAPVQARVSGLARFRSRDPEGDPIVHLLQHPTLNRLKVLVEVMARQRGWPGRPDDFVYTPHVTLRRSRAPHAEAFSDLPDLVGYLLAEIWVCAGDAYVSHQLAGVGK